MIARYGADALRLYVMFVAPPEKEVEWTDAGLEGSYRFLGRVWRLVDQWCSLLRGAEVPAAGLRALTEPERSLRRKTHDTVRRVTSDLDPRVHLNTAISALMELVNELYAFTEQHTRVGLPGRRGEVVGAGGERPEAVAVAKEAIEALVLMLSPFAPHTSEELWELLGHQAGLASAAWPGFDPTVARPTEVVVPVQVNGKLRGRLVVSSDATEEELRERALSDAAVKAHLGGKTVRNVIVARGRLVNVVVQ
jgi:leucyl-tRNA synthetase